MKKMRIRITRDGHTEIRPAAVAETAETGLPTDTVAGRQARMVDL